MVAIAAGPAAVDPRTHHNHVLRPWALLLSGTIEPKRPEQIFSIEPSAHRHHGRLHAFHILPDIASLPVWAIGVVVNQFLPVLNLSLKELLVEILQRARLQIELV